MKLPFILLFFATVFSIKASAQNTLNKGGTLYPATNQWLFKCKNNMLLGDFKVQLARGNKRGYLQLSIYADLYGYFFGKPVSITLSDNSSIEIDNLVNKEDNNNGFIVATFSIPEDQINILKRLDIIKIDFLIVSEEGTEGGPKGQYSGYNVNLNDVTSKNEKQGVASIKTAAEFSSLYD